LAVAGGSRKVALTTGLREPNDPAAVVQRRGIDERAIVAGASA